MTRAKVKLAYITNEAARKAAFKKRKKGMMKKMNELSTLCGIEACAIVFGSGNPQPEVWPNPSGARHVISKYRVVPDLLQAKKKLNQESFMKQRMEKAREQLKKMRRENKETAMRVVMAQCVGGMGMEKMSMRNLSDVAWMIEKTLKEIDKKMEAMNEEQMVVAAKEEVYVPEPPVASEGFMTHINVRNPQSSLELEMSGNQQLWNNATLNSLDPLGFGGDEMRLSFGDIDEHNAFWPHIVMS